jgi:hypothetical protein
MTRHEHPRLSMFSPFTALLLAALPLLAACGAKVSVDPEMGTGGGGGAGATGSGGGTTSASSGGLSCGEEPTEGKIVAVCVSSVMSGDTCPPGATTPGLLKVLADAMGVCTQTSPGVCCGQPALVQVVCDLPISNDQCCYHAHYFESAGCN